MDENIPYLDLEHYSKQWEYQREVLLPRGLTAIREKEEIVNYKWKTTSINLKTYTMRISMSGLPELPVDDRMPDTKSKNKFLLDKQRTEIIKIYNMFVDDSDYTDEKDDMSELLEYLYNWSKRGMTTTSQYKEISDKILNTLKSALPGMKTSDIVKDSCKQHIDEILAKVESILETEDKLIVPTNYIEVEEC
jgi:hemerythrin